MRTVEVFNFRYFDLARSRWMTSREKAEVTVFRQQYPDAFPLEYTREERIIDDEPLPLEQ
ncbi:hypothetical protein [Chitinolyticbacter meiyuanensis]|uniref:hypothetical protein n=1 Tax=Chitinolyticbacter meiyuanensis TaxID=682798 RepID=UPI0011E5A55B|nr:hypothetical protein [Chitinolyticbacter meiyuanensis]